MRNLKMTAVAAAFVGSAAVAMAPTEAFAVASFDVNSGGTLYYGSSVNAGGERINGNISGQGRLTFSLVVGGETIFSSQSEFSSNDTVTTTLPGATTLTSSGATSPTIPRGRFDFNVNYVGLTGALGGQITGGASATLKIDLESTSATAFRVNFALDPEFSALLTATDPLRDSSSALANLGVVQVGAEGTFVLNNPEPRSAVRTIDADERLLGFTLMTGASVGALSSAAVTFNSFGSAQTEVIPVPAALPLLASALLGVGFLARRRRKAA